MHLIVNLIRIAIDGVSERMGRTAMLASGVAVGVCSILVLVSLVSGTNAFLHDEVVGNMPDTVLDVTSGVARDNEPARMLDEAAYREVCLVTDVISVFRENQFAGRAMVSAKDIGTIDLEIFGIDPIYFVDEESFRKDFFVYKEGATEIPVILPMSFYLAYDTIPMPKNVPVGASQEELIEHLEASLTLNDSMHVNTSARKKKLPLRVLGFSSRVDTPGIYVPIGYTQEWNRWWEEEVGEQEPVYRRFIVFADSAMGVTPVKQEIEALRLRATPASRQQIYDRIAQASEYISSASWLIGGIILLVSAVAIISGLTAAVQEQVRRIGVMRAIGARRRDVLAIFMTEAVLIGILGVGFGLFVGLALIEWLDVLGHTVLRGLIQDIFLSNIITMPETLFRTSARLVSGTIIFGIGVSLVAGILPAWRATRIDPAVVLREN